MSIMHLHFEASSAPLAQQALKELTTVYVQNPIEDADIVVALGGDGWMLECMKRSIINGKRLYGMNLGTKGYLMNPFRISDLIGRIDRAKSFEFHPLNMTVSFQDQPDTNVIAFNECTLRRMHCQTAHIRIRSFLDGIEKIIADEMIGDGVIVSSPLGSTGYYKSAGARPLSWTCSKIGIQSVCANPKIHTRIDNHAELLLDNLDTIKRPLIASGDNQEHNHPTQCRIVQERQKKAVVMFDRSVYIKKKLLQCITR